MELMFDLISDKHPQINLIKILDLDGVCARFIRHCIIHIGLRLVIQSTVLCVMLNSQSTRKDEIIVILD